MQSGHTKLKIHMGHTRGDGQETSRNAFLDHPLVSIYN